MSFFGNIIDKIFHHSTAQASTLPPSGTTQPTTTPAAPTVPAGTASLQSVDVEAVLVKLASTQGGGGNWRTSIVDLLKMLDLDSSLQARKTLAQELNVHVGADGTAEQNIALQKAVWAKLAENGGKVPDSLRN